LYGWRLASALRLGLVGFDPEKVPRLIGVKVVFRFLDRRFEVADRLIFLTCSPSPDGRNRFNRFETATRRFGCNQLHIESRNQDLNFSQSGGAQAIFAEPPSCQLADFELYLNLVQRVLDDADCSNLMVLLRAQDLVRVLWEDTTLRRCALAKDTGATSMHEFGNELIEGKSEKANNAPGAKHSQLIQSTKKFLRLQTEVDANLKDFPKDIFFLIDFPPGFESEDLMNFFALLKVTLAQISVANPLALIFVRDFVVAEIELLRIAQLEQQVVRAQQKTIIRDKVEAVLRNINPTDPYLASKAATVARLYLENTAQREKAVEDYNLANLIELEAEAVRLRAADLARIGQLRKACEQRRDRAFKMLSSLRKEEAQRVRAAATEFQTNADKRSGQPGDELAAGT
jgi:hypothetical protein